MVGNEAATRSVHDSQALKTSASLLLAAALASVAPVAPFAQVKLPAQSPSAIQLPSLGDSASDAFSVSTERRLGEQIMREIRRDNDYLDDPLLLEYVQSLWTPLLAASRARGNIGPDIDASFGWETFLVRDRSVNAFALPGGYVGVHLGLIAMTASRDELASVLAHELSHVTQRHIARSITSSSRQSMIGMAAMIIGLLVASRSSNSDVGQAAVVGSQAAMVQGQLNFSRDMEREADRIGWGVFTGAGFAPAGVAAMFEKLEAAYRHNDSGAFPYLRSHPLTVERIGDARSRLDSLGAARATPAPTFEHALMQARARVLMDAGVQALRRQQGQDVVPASATRAERLGALYGSALASLRLREAPRAQAAIDAAQAALRTSPAPDARAERALQLLQAEALLAAQQPASALALLEPLTPASRPLMLARAQAALDAARAGGSSAALRSSTEALQTWVAEQRNDAAAWSLLAQCAEQGGLRLRAIRAEAEATAALGALGGAIARLRAGQRLARASAGAPDFIEASIIDARLRDLTALRRQLLAEARGERGPDRGGERPEPPQ